jgi:hypothetical protein
MKETHILRESKRKFPGAIVGTSQVASFHSTEFMSFTMNHSQPQKANF